MCEIIASPPKFEVYGMSKYLEKKYFPYLCEVCFHCVVEGVDQTHKRPLIHAAVCLHCGEAVLGSKGKEKNGRGSR